MFQFCVPSFPIAIYCSSPRNSLITSLWFCSAFISIFMCHVSHLICCCFPSPSTPHSASCGLNVAPAHTSARHKAVQVWLESVSGGSTDLKGISASHLSISPLGLFPQHAQTHNCALTSMLAARLPLRVFTSTLRSQVLTSSQVFSMNPSLYLHFWMNVPP